MLTITGIIKYIPKVTTQIKPKRGSAEETRQRRARAREVGKCGVCASRWPTPGKFTCEPCLSQKAKRKKRNTSTHSIVAAR